tara:strand:+ start:311 stop:631 length:321 start_codon:yes stop_codon:yes gene_type:complete
MKKVLLIFFCIFLNNCSYAALRDQDKVSERCSALNYTAPVIDTAATAMSIAFLAILPTAIALGSHGSSSPSNAEVFQVLGVTIASTTVFGSSAVYGYRKTYKCRSK